LVIFIFLQQRWFQSGHGDTQQQKEKSVILPTFWAARSAASFVKRRWFLSSGDSIYFLQPCQRRYWTMDVVVYDRLKARLLETI
jgi:hypothetical protein